MINISKRSNPLTPQSEVSRPKGLNVYRGSKRIITVNGMNRTFNQQLTANNVNDFDIDKQLNPSLKKSLHIKRK